MNSLAYFIAVPISEIPSLSLANPLLEKEGTRMGVSIVVPEYLWMIFVLLASIKPH